MNNAILEISWQGLLIAFVPAAVVIGIMVAWRSIVGTALYATARMLVQLLLIGYVLIYIFETDNWLVIAAVLLVMLTVSSWIATRTLDRRTRSDYLQALVAIATGGVLTLAVVTQFVIGVEPWFSPRYVVPLAGMAFAGSMNAVSLAADRYQAETSSGSSYPEARRTALQTALIPIINSLFAVGVVALPGMMTGQILSGVSPLVAAKYQIVVMTMLFGAAGISAAVYLVFQRPG
ncbi:MAG: ABC transporter permease [Woeseiaceae bacterium]|nr:ABC transporter permease [Woeseiaceae bacterium]